METFSKHMQQGRNVWYCPTTPIPVQVDNPRYRELRCPVCGELATPERIR